VPGQALPPGLSCPPLQPAKRPPVPGPAKEQVPAQLQIEQAIPQILPSMRTSATSACHAIPEAYRPGPVAPAQELHRSGPRSATRDSRPVRAIQPEPTNCRGSELRLVPAPRLLDLPLLDLRAQMPGVAGARNIPTGGRNLPALERVLKGVLKRVLERVLEPAPEPNNSKPAPQVDSERRRKHRK
jgi:hypothetical protein